MLTVSNETIRLFSALASAGISLPPITPLCSRLYNYFPLTLPSQKHSGPLWYSYSLIADDITLEALVPKKHQDGLLYVQYIVG